jgi:hypothetical protein
MTVHGVKEAAAKTPYHSAGETRVAQTTNQEVQIALHMYSTPTEYYVLWISKQRSIGPAGMRKLLRRELWVRRFPLMILTCLCVAQPTAS